MIEASGRTASEDSRPPLPKVFARYEMPSPAELDEAVVELKMLQKRHSDAKWQGYYDRLQRGCSWLAKAKRSASGPEAGFIFSWIALNALCGVRPEVLKTEWWRSEAKSRPSLHEQQYDDETPRELEWFLWRVCGLDINGGVLRDVIKDCWSDVKTILRTRYLMSNFWAWKWRTEDEIERWKGLSERKVKDATGQVFDREKMYRALCELIVWRMRTLRNQPFHGCTTDIHSKRREAGESELEASFRLLGQLVWAFLALMATESGYTRYWPPIPYPRAGSAQHQPFNFSWLPAMRRHDA